jgi:hypothetical protein
VIPGHPFFTEQLDRQRAEQRLVLAGIPDRTLEAVGANRADPAPPEPTGRVETTLRRLAGPLIEAMPEKVLEDLALPVEKQALLTWAQEEVDWSRWPNQVADMVGDAASTSRDDAAVAAQLVERHDEQLTRIAALLVLADDLADDYVDPRIKRWRDRRATST